MGSEVSLGDAMMSIDTRENRSLPEWIEQSVLPLAHEDRKPLVDIYSEILKTQEMLRDMSADVQYLVAESQRRHMQPHRRFWRWLKGLLETNFGGQGPEKEC